MTAIEHKLVSRSAINVSLIDLMTSNQINGGNGAHTQGGIILPVGLCHFGL